MPLHAQAKIIDRTFDALDNAVAGDGVHHHLRSHILHRLVVGAVHSHGGAVHDKVKQGARRHRHLMAGLVPRVWLFMGQRVRYLVGNMLDQSPS